MHNANAAAGTCAMFRVLVVHFAVYRIKTGSFLYFLLHTLSPARSLSLSA